MMQTDISKASKIIVFQNGIWRSGCGFDYHDPSRVVDNGSYISANGDTWPLTFLTTLPIPIKLLDNRRYRPYVIFTYVSDGGASNHLRQIAFSSGVNSGYNSESRLGQELNVIHDVMYAGIQADGYYLATQTNHYAWMKGATIKQSMDCLPGVFIGLYYATTYISEIGVIID